MDIQSKRLYKEETFKKEIYKEGIYKEEIYGKYKKEIYRKGILGVRKCSKGIYIRKILSRSECTRLLCFVDQLDCISTSP